MALQNEANTLLALENLMNEFFDPSTGNPRKRDIEAQLETFSSQRDSWRPCVYFIKHSQNQYVCMYSLTTIESVINRQWQGLEWEARSQLRSSLWDHLTQQHASNARTGTPLFLRNKLAKLVVDIARHDWPHFYPDFFNNIIQLIQSEQGRLLGLVLLRTASEELGGARDDLSSSRRNELARLMLLHTTPALQTLTVLLETLATRQKGASVTKTPPPSPTHPSCTPRLPTLSDAPTMRPDTRETCREVLLTVQHMFSWIPLTEIRAPLVRAIFHFASAMSYTQDDDDICVLALSALCELLYRRVAPPGSEPLLLQLAHGAVQLLSHITNESTNSLDTLSNSFIDKFTEFIQLLVSVHLRRLEAEPNFSTVEFLSLLFRYTFLQTNISSFLACFDVWTAFLKQLKPENSHKYSEAVIGLATGLLNKIQFQNNQSQLEELDNEQADDDEKTEWQHFLNQCIETVAMISEFSPVHIFTLVLTSWRDMSDIYLRLSSAVDQSENRLNIHNRDEILHLHCALRDLATLTQVLGRLSTSFMDEDDKNCQNSRLPRTFVSQLITCVLYATQNRLHKVHVPLAKLTIDLVEVHAQLLACIASWLTWPGLDLNTRNQVLCELVRAVSPLLLPSNIDTDQSKRITHSAAHLLLRISTVSSPDILLPLPPIRELVQCVHIGSHLETQSSDVVRRALCNMLVQPCNSVSELQRSSLLSEIIEGLTGPLRILENSTDAACARQIISSTLIPLATLIEHYRHHSVTVKKTLYSGVKPPVELALNLFPRFSDSPDITDHILTLYLTVIGVLRQQLGVDYTRHAVEIFLDAAGSNQNQQRISGVEKLLQILQLVVEEPGIAFRCLLPGTIRLCLQHALPIISSQPGQNPDLATSLFSLLHGILLHRWQYFYKSHVRLGHSPGASDTSIVESDEERLQNGEELIAILQAFGQALLQSDINTFRLSLASLENLNTKWKLYHQYIFREQLLGEFITVLLQTLLNKSHALLSEDIIMAIYNMAVVDFNTFRNTFLLHFLNTTEGLDNHQRETLLRNFSRESDMPTLTQNILRLVNDLRCYRLCNASLPAGSVTL